MAKTTKSPSGKSHHNYPKENKWEDTPRQVARRSGRNKARAKLEKQGRVKKGDGKEVDHKNFNATDNSASNLHVMTKTANRKKQPKRK